MIDHALWELQTIDSSPNIYFLAKPLKPEVPNSSSFLFSIMSESQELQFESNACDQCYRTKQTCTKNVPNCQRCLKNSTPCTYSFGKFMGKPKKRYKNRFTEEKNVTKEAQNDVETERSSYKLGNNSVVPNSKHRTLGNYLGEGD